MADCLYGSSNYNWAVPRGTDQFSNLISIEGRMSVEARLARHGHVSYLEIPAVDIEQSADFYESVLGWQIHQGQSGHISFDDRSGDLIGRWVTGRVPSREPGVLPYIYVDRIDDVVQRVVNRGGEIVKAP